MAPPPPELYLRQARQTDLQDPKALLDFVRTVGGVPYIEEDRDLFPRPRRPGVSSPTAETVGTSSQLVAGRGIGVHLDEVAYRLRMLEILGQHAVAYRRGNYLAPVWNEVYAKSLLGSRSIKTEEEAWWEFSVYANQALQGFHVRVRALGADGKEIGGHGEPTFLEAGVLQLVNDLADEVDYLTCPNCSLIFARSVGGSTHYSRSTGVTYCSPRCATGARVKAYRARKRAEGK